MPERKPYTFDRVVRLLLGVAAIVGVYYLLDFERCTVTVFSRMADRIPAEPVSRQESEVLESQRAGITHHSVVRRDRYFHFPIGYLGFTVRSQ